jgi:hypothetical protein
MNRTSHADRHQRNFRTVRVRLLQYPCPKLSIYRHYTSNPARTTTFFTQLRILNPGNNRQARHHPPSICASPRGGDDMVWTIFVILVALWLLGLVPSYALGGFINILLVVAVIGLIVELISSRRPVP